MNREQSWLKFNERVLEEAESEKNPLCEKLSFVSIYQSNLDEFFMVRVGSLIDQMLLDKNIRENKTELTAGEQLDAVLDRVRILNERKDILYSRLMGRLEEHNVLIVDFRNIEKKGNKRLEDYFNSEIIPFLSPVIVGDRQPFPFLRNKEIYAAALEQILEDCEKSTGVKIEMTYEGSVDIMQELKNSAPEYDAVWTASSLFISVFLHSLCGVPLF